MTEETEKKCPKPVILIVLDGWGVTEPFQGNAIALAKTDFFDELVAKYPAMTISASGESVGLPWGEAGNSEVGHMNLGAGRIIYQDFPRINRAIVDHSFYKNKVLLDAIEHVRKNNSRLHFLGLLSNGGVHSSVDHFHALAVLAKEKGLSQVFLHAILDGRDTSYNSGINFVKSAERTMRDYGIGEIASLSGRFFTMDRNNNWERIAKAYAMLVEGVGNEADDPIDAIEKSYKKKIYDEEFVPTVIIKNGNPVAVIQDNDAVIFFNFRQDRARQITNAFVRSDFDKFKRKKFLNNLYFACFTQYEIDLPAPVVFPPEQIKNTLGEVLSQNGLRQLRIAETEKYAHVTYFFNGGDEDDHKGEKHVLIPSLPVESYDLRPEMSADAIAERVLSEIEKNIFDFILINFANADMVGHTANIAATSKAVEVIDENLKKIVNATLEKDGVILITADHGNAEVLFDMATGTKDKEHNANPVPLLLVGKEYEGKNFGWQSCPTTDLSLVQPQGILADVSPTILKLLGIPKPPEMTGESLI
jgi:2,3-bisphosphoglycerate-independent phosphoglycerate mutase